MSSPGGPPAQPPQLSPDHKWFWDGSAWQPIAQHEAVFPTWRGVGAGLPTAQAAPAVQRIPSPPPQPARRAPVGAPAYRLAPPPPNQAAAPLWRQDNRRLGPGRYLYFAAGAIALVLVGVVLTSLGTITLPWQQAAAQPAVASPTPALSSRSDRGVADSFINGMLSPRLADVYDSIVMMRQACPAGMTASCQDGLVGIDNRTGRLLQQIDAATVPLCIAAPTAAIRLDLSKVDGWAQYSIKAFRANRAADVQTGWTQLSATYTLVQADGNAVVNASKVCDTQLTGP